MTNHVWLITDDKIIIDITGDQFGDKWESVYVGLEIGNYEKFTRVVTQKNFDIRELPRLWNDYNIMLKYLNDITATIIQQMIYDVKMEFWFLIKRIINDFKGIKFIYKLYELSNNG